MNDFSMLLADPDRYLPIERTIALDDPGEHFAPTGMPAPWTRRDRGVWRLWSPGAVALPAQGWKVHVSASLPRASHVLDVAAAVCVEHGVPFKRSRRRGPCPTAARPSTG